MRIAPIAIVLTASAAFGALGYRALYAVDPNPLPTGRQLSAPANSTNVASFPANMVVSPDGRYIVVTNTGYRQQLSILDRTDGRLVSSQSFNAGARGSKQSLYFGLAFDSEGLLHVSRGSEGRISVFRLGGDGKLESVRDSAVGPKGQVYAGLDLIGDDTIVAGNITDATSKLQGELYRIKPDGTSAVFARVGGFPLDVKVVGDTVFSSSERDGVVNAIENGNATAIKTGVNPSYLLESEDGLWVSNSGSDTISLIDPAAKKVKRTVQLRPAEFRGLPVCTPLGLAAHGDRLYVALADLNAVAVVDRQRGSVLGYIPTGWHPTSCVLSADGATLFVANAKGERPRVPNDKPDGANGTYIQNILEGTVSKIDLKGNLQAATAQVLSNSNIARRKQPFSNPGIKHVIYIIKENRTYDNVLGDLPQGNGDPSLCLFPREVTPNQHAFAERFALLDNFSVCAEVSGDGWNWSTSGMVNEFTSRNVVYNYSGRGRSYDFEGDNAGTSAMRAGVRDVAEAPNGYIWDAAVKAKVTLRNYGMFVGEVEALGTKGAVGNTNPANKKTLLTSTDESFCQYDLAYADSEAYERHGITWPRALKTFGKFGSTNRVAEWRREFDAFEKKGTLPRLSLLRIPNDHTRGTAAGAPSPRSMVADNDYAVGQIVDRVSHSKFWASTAIVILEDDAQAGIDHVDCHRSICFVVSPFTKRAFKDSRFYNTDSALRTIEALLGIPPMNGYDAAAVPIDVFARDARNDEPYTAILPAKEILAETNVRTSYRSSDSQRMIDPRQEESLADVELNDILWHSIKGKKPLPTLVGKPPEEDDQD